MAQSCQREFEKLRILEWSRQSSRVCKVASDPKLMFRRLRQFDGVIEDRSKSGFFQSLFITTHVSSNTSIDLVRVGVNYRFH